METKKVNKLMLILPLLLLIVLTISATFAYYGVTTNLKNTKASLNAHAENVGLVTFQNGTKDLEIKVTPTDMNQKNKGNKYYAVEATTLEDNGSKYSRTEKNHIILTGTVNETNTDEKYFCTGTLTIKLNGTMQSALQNEDVKIRLTGTNVKIDDKYILKVDANEIENGTKQLPLSFIIDKNESAQIVGDIILENRNNDQTDLAGNNLEISISIEERPACHIALEKEIPPKTISLGEYCQEENMAACLENNSENIGSVTNLTASEVGGMYRYQGTDKVDNWICFGTNDKSACTSNIDKYMYRIIGITPSGELALIKETGVREDKEVSFQMHYTAWVSECGTDGSTCSWPSTRLFQRLNGLCNEEAGNCPGTNSGTSGDTNIFIGNDYYDYLSDDTWLNIIEDHEWKYGDATSDDYNGDSIYELEKEFTQNKSAKIGLQYIHDYYYAYPGGNPGNEITAKEAWIHLSKDDLANITSEWLMTRTIDESLVNAWFIFEHGYVNKNDLGYGHGVRPVFYLKSDIKLSNSLGTKNDPFIIMANLNLD